MARLDHRCAANSCSLKHVVLKKNICFSLALTLTMVSCAGQTIAIANERENVLTVGLDNPLSIAVEKIAANSIVAKTNNGILTGKNGAYILRPAKAGLTTITIFESFKGKLKEIGKKYFRARLLLDPVFRIGSGKRTMQKKELLAQEYVGATLENSDFQLNFRIDSFRVCIVHTDTCRYSIKANTGNMISKELHEEFEKLTANDTILFTDIYCTGPGGQRKIAPLLIFVSE